MDAHLHVVLAEEEHRTFGGDDDNAGRVTWSSSAHRSSVRRGEGAGNAFCPPVSARPTRPCLRLTRRRRRRREPGRGAAEQAALTAAERTAGPTAGPTADAPPAPATVVRTLAPLTVTGDRALLGHLVRNLPANAVRHNRAGGRIVVETSADGELTVSNTGPVIDPADVTRLLEPFRRRAERQHTAGEGAGLGLSIVAAVARAHGATLAVEANAEPEGGLTVRVRFPLADRRDASPGAPGSKIR
ncbi:sensor histidine kinase [Streptomyces sp. NPDC002467]|uniref:sensor histidine kinase n=1 Tax=Streptomyces sp. NPDC002467 TaxID=3364647 RepID=UPI0036C31D43